MPWSGSAPNESYSRTDGTRNGATVWQQAESAAVNIVSDDHDTHDQDIATAINACLKKDGGNTASGDLPLGNNKITGLGNPTSDQDAATQISSEKAIGGRGTDAKTDTDSPVTVAVGDEGKVFTADATSGAITFNLPAAASAGDKWAVRFIKIDSSANAITLDGNASETINGAATWTLSNQWDVATLRCDGSNFHVVSGNISQFSNLYIEDDIIHAGDADNLISFGTDTQDFQTGGSSRLDISDSGVRLGAANARVTTVLDEDDMSSDSATALATQQSVKAYVDANQSGVAFLGTIDLSADASADFGANATPAITLDISTYDVFEFFLMNVIPATDNVDLYVRTSANGGTAYDAGAADYGYSYSGYRNGYEEGYSASAAQMLLFESTGSAANEEGISGKVTLLGAHLANYTQVTAELVGIDSAARPQFLSGGGIRLSAAAANGLQFLFDSGNIESGTITVYGRKNS